VSPFLTVRRRAVVDLPAPWDPEKVLKEYADDPGLSQELHLSEVQLATLRRDGFRVRIDARHRWMGAMAGEMRVAVLSPLTVEVDIDGWATVRRWLQPFVLLFRPRLRKAVERQIDQLIDELGTEPVLDTDEESVPTAPERPERPTRLTWNVEVLTMAGQVVYQQREGS